jgi:hypothetical protein
VQRLKIICAALCLAAIPMFSVRAQEKPSQSFFIQLLFPRGLGLGYKMRSHIAMNLDTLDQSREADLKRVDDLYSLAIEWSHGSTSTALFMLAFGAFDHEYLPLRILGAEVDLPLTSESHSEFERRASKLPLHPYNDSIRDQDKLQHFFASAWLKQIVGMDWLAKLAGHLVELGEASFVIGGANDSRDEHANADGRRFGVTASGNPNVLPSSFFTPNP